MRSVFFHLIDVTRQEVATHLSAIAGPNGVDNWRLPPDSSRPALYIGFYDDLLAEAEPDDLEALRSALGRLPEVSVIADVSGRIPGDSEVRQLAELILQKFCGVAGDNYTHHCWTLDEIQSGTKASGHTFFDYEGWERERPSA